MRISVTQSDLLVIRKAAKLLRKHSPQNPKQAPTLNTISEWMGYIDHKKLKRLVVDSPNTLPIQNCEALKSSAEQWLVNQGFNSDMTLALNSLQLNKLSAFSFEPNTRPIVNRQQLNTSTTDKPIMLIYDEWATYAQPMFEGEKDGGIVDFLKVLGLPCWEWWVPEKSKLSQPSVIVLEKLLPLVKPMSERIIDGSNFHFWNEEQKNSARNEVISFYPQAMVSALEALSTHSLNIKPFGFEIIDGFIKGHKSTKIYGLYNTGIYSFIPFVWASYEEAQSSLAILLTTGSTSALKGSDSIDGLVDWNISNVHHTESNLYTSATAGHLKFNIEALPNPNIQLHTIQRFDHFDNISPIEQLIDSKPLEGEIYNFWWMENVPNKNSNLKIWISDETITHLNNCSASIKTLLGKANATLNASDIDGHILLQSLKSHNFTDDNSQYLDIDNPDTFKKEFPWLSEHFKTQEMDSWHLECAISTGAIRKTCGYISVTQSEMIGHLIYLIVTGNSCTTENNRNIGSVLAASAIQDKRFDINKLSRLATEMKMKFKELKYALRTLNSLVSAINEVEEKRESVVMGERRFTLRDMRGQPSPVTATQSMDDYIAGSKDEQGVIGLSMLNSIGAAVINSKKIT